MVREPEVPRVNGQRWSIEDAARVLYEQVAYGVALREWLLDNSPSDLRELATLLRTALNLPQPTIEG